MEFVLKLRNNFLKFKQSFLVKILHALTDANDILQTLEMNYNDYPLALSNHQ